jgi:hypothetical protein
VAIYLLYGWLGPSAFVSLAVVLLLMPIKFLIFQYVWPTQSTSCGVSPLHGLYTLQTIRICRAFNSYEEKIMEHKDERVRQLTEALQVCVCVCLLAATNC